MSEPPRDAPPPEQQEDSLVEATFEPSPTGPELCGFGAPTFGLSLNLPPFSFPPPFWPPVLNLAIGLNCDLSDPIDAQFEFGGGRVGTSDVDQDDEFVVG